MKDETILEESTFRAEVRSPRAAALAGIAFSLLMLTSMILVRRIGLDSYEEVTGEWIQKWSRSVAWIIGSTPFVGLAFLWFTGVMRDLLGIREDKLFATVFLGSSIMFILGLFLWAALFGAIVGMYAVADTHQIDSSITMFGAQLMNEILGSFALRMAGVYMMSIGALWQRTKVVPIWLTLLTMVLGVFFLFLSGLVRDTRFVFPSWVLLVSVYILVTNYHRSSQDDALRMRGSR